MPFACSYCGGNHRDNDCPRSVESEEGLTDPVATRGEDDFEGFGTKPKPKPIPPQETGPHSFVKSS